MSISGLKLAPLCLLLPAILAAVGCPSTGTTRATSQQRATASDLSRRADRGEVLLETVVKQLGELPSYIDTELLPPVVILDSTKSRDQQDVLAMCTTPPDSEEGLINYLFVPEGNSRFRALGVRPGDIVKYYVTLDEEASEFGISQEAAMEFPVAQVANDGALYLAGGLNMPVLEPAKIEVWRYVDDRLVEISRQLGRYVEYRLPPRGWEPSPDERVLNQIVDRLNQWLRQSQPKTEWQSEPLLETLEVDLATDEKLAPNITAAALGALSFEPYDGRLIQEAVWHRDLARWAQGDDFEALARASALFDWTIRNIQLDGNADAQPLRPWQTLMYGHGTAEQRAWVFAMLCRQQGLDVVVLSVPETAQSADGPPVKSRFWLPALLHNGQLYLFDTRLGLPIPGPDGNGVATLAQLQADPAVLRRLDLDDEVYAVTAEQLAHVTANVVADPFDLSRRARLLEVQLSGDDQLALTSNVAKVVDKLKGIPGVEKVRIWDTPFRTLRDQLSLGNTARRGAARAFEPFAWRPTLWKARVLHFEGHDKVVVDPRHPGLEDTVNDHAEAMELYTSGSVRPPDRLIAELPQPEKRRIYSTAKDDASYWIGLLLFDEASLAAESDQAETAQEKFAAAENWFRHPKLAAGDDSAWSDGTRYNLARTYEAQGKTDEAIALYERDTSPQRVGNLLRARWLKDKSGSAQP